MKRHLTPRDELRKVEGEFKKIVDPKQRVFERYPLLFSLLGAFGLVATFYGFEKLIDTVPFLQDNPVILLAVGIASLVATGTLYKKL